MDKQDVEMVKGYEEINTNNTGQDRCNHRSPFMEDKKQYAQKCQTQLNMQD